MVATFGFNRAEHEPCGKCPRFLCYNYRSPRYPITTRVVLNGTIVVARDIAHAKLAERLEATGSLPDYMYRHVIYYAGPAKTPEGCATGTEAIPKQGSRALIAQQLDELSLKS